MNSDCIQNLLFFSNSDLCVYHAQCQQVLLASKIYYGLKYPVCKIMLLFTLPRYFHSVRQNAMVGGEGVLSTVYPV